MGFHLGWAKTTVPELETPTGLVTVGKGKERAAPANIDQMDVPPVVSVPHMSMKPPRGSALQFELLRARDKSRLAFPASPPGREQRADTIVSISWDEWP